MVSDCTSQTYPNLATLMGMMSELDVNNTGQFRP